MSESQSQVNFLEVDGGGLMTIKNASLESRSEALDEDLKHWTKNQAEELGREPTVDEVFLTTHIRKKDKSWVDDRSRKTYDTFQTKLSQASEGADESGSQMVDSATRLKLWAKSAGGGNRGRLYGAGDSSSIYRPAEDEVRNTREELRQAELKRQKEVHKSEQQAVEFQRQLIALTNSVAALQADASLRQRRHPDYDEDESEDGSKDGSEDEYDSTSDDDNEEN
ncbi:hypothetical protein QL285_028285 [Trifolium repens]|nr:hypothetical protein QL285_028285 [Trifolium repens]